MFAEKPVKMEDLSLTKIKETCLYVQDLERSKKFYEEVLGLCLISFIPGRHAFFRVGQEVLLCFNPEATQAEAVLPPHFARGKQHIAFEVPEKDYHLWKEKLLKQGVSITHEHKWKDNLFSFYFEDPDQHVLEILMPGIWE